MENAKVQNVQFPDDLNIISAEPEVGAGELAEQWEIDKMLEAMILEEELKEQSGLPAWVRRIF